MKFSLLALALYTVSAVKIRQDTVKGIMAAFDSNGDNVITPYEAWVAMKKQNPTVPIPELKEEFKKVKKEWDVNSDGKVTKAEVKAVLAKRAAE